MGADVEWGQASAIVRRGIVAVSPETARTWFGSHWEIPADSYVLAVDAEHCTVAITGSATELQCLAATLTTTTARLDSTGEPHDPVADLRATVSELHALYADRDRFSDDYEDDHGTGLDAYDAHELDHLYAVLGAAEDFLGIPAFDFGAH